MDPFRRHELFIDYRVDSIKKHKRETSTQITWRSIRCCLQGSPCGMQTLDKNYLRILGHLFPLYWDGEREFPQIHSLGKNYIFET